MFTKPRTSQILSSCFAFFIFPIRFLFLLQKILLLFVSLPSPLNFFSNNSPVLSSSRSVQMSLMFTCFRAANLTQTHKFRTSFTIFFIQNIPQEFSHSRFSFFYFFTAISLFSKWFVLESHKEFFFLGFSAYDLFHRCVESSI